MLGCRRERGQLLKLHPQSMGEESCSQEWGPCICLNKRESKTQASPDRAGGGNKFSIVISVKWEIGQQVRGREGMR